MAINLSKGQKISLSKEAPNLKVALVGLGWDIKQYDSGADYDLDASIFLLDANGKCAHESDFIFYNNLSSNGVTHSGDNRTGEGDGDDEAVTIEFEKVPDYIRKSPSRSQSTMRLRADKTSARCRTRSSVWWTSRPVPSCSASIWARIIRPKRRSYLRKSIVTTANGSSPQSVPASTADSRRFAGSTA